MELALYLFHYHFLSYLESIRYGEYYCLCKNIPTELGTVLEARYLKFQYSVFALLLADYCIFPFVYGVFNSKVKKWVMEPDYLNSNPNFTMALINLSNHSRP